MDIVEGSLQASASEVRLPSGFRTFRRTSCFSPSVATFQWQVRFRFQEDLCFNLPLVKPVVPLSGELILTRNPTSGLIIKYLEVWDEGVAQVLSRAHL